ncbi:CAP domain-containing protein [Candidatus Atribacteria bacterium 1244-E10-H5-B2]|nr:MAG: CAP domain-containing protein [Candidatus Atribacteria bacterium 1244-E10-H5-B2]
MRVKLKIILIITLAAALIATIAFSNAFSYKAANIDRSFTESSTYKTEDIGKAVIIKENISIKDNSIDTGAILSRISDNLDKEINSIYKEYKAEVLGNATTSKATEIAAAPVESITNLNEFEAAVLYLINTIRVSNGLGALEPNQMLTDIARSRSNDMIINSYFSHYTPDGRNIFNIFRENGVSYVNAGENLGQSTPASSGTPEALTDAWMASPTHKANILRSVYSKIGIGVVDGGDRRVVATVFIN